MRGFVQCRSLVAAVTQRARGPSCTCSYSAGLRQTRDEGLGSYGDTEDSIFNESFGHGYALHSASAARGQGRVQRGFGNRDRTLTGVAHNGNKCDEKGGVTQIETRMVEEEEYRQRQAVRFVPGLLWRNPWTHATFGRAYGSAAENRKREVRVSGEADDENDNDDTEEPSEFEDEYDVEDEQHIEDSDDNAEEEAVVLERSPKKKKFTPPKIKLPDQEGRCLNEKVTARFVRLVGEDGKSHRVVSRHEALTLAKAKKMDLVQVDTTSEPPVCKIFDFHKEEYRQTQILKDRKKKKGAMAHLSEVKEIRFTAKTELKDLKMKVEKAEGFTDRGYRVKFVAMFKAKADDEKKRLEEEKIIDSVCSMVKSFAIIEQGPRVESRQAWVILRHVKFAKNSSSKRKPQTVESPEHKEQIEQAS